MHPADQSTIVNLSQQETNSLIQTWGWFHPDLGCTVFFSLGEQLTGFALWINIISFVRKLPCHQLFKPNIHVLICGGLQTALRQASFPFQIWCQVRISTVLRTSPSGINASKFGAYRFAICCRRRTKYLIFNPQNSRELTENKHRKTKATSHSRSLKLGKIHHTSCYIKSQLGPNGSHLPSGKRLQNELENHHL